MLALLFTVVKKRAGYLYFFTLHPYIWGAQIFNHLYDKREFKDACQVCGYLECERGRGEIYVVRVKEDMKTPLISGAP